jgi:transcriptional regulator with AAA-type ATPase domain
MAKTERMEEDGGGGSAEDRSPRVWLVRIGCATEPLRGPRLLPLTGDKRWVLGREGGAGRADDGRIESRDRWMSGEHAQLSLGLSGWELSDLGSSNGTLVWGQRRSSARLVNGDIFETGSTFWLFRSMPLGDAWPAPGSESVVGSFYPPFMALASRLSRIARTRVPVMILGPTGTGKELLARQLHTMSQRTGPFVAINTAAVQANLVASELFGVERGAHSMADRARPGQIRAAEGGTLLLDEIGDMPPEVQVSLLRVLQEGEVVPVGGDAPVKVDVRFVCATHQDLKALVQRGDFRADLFARLKGATLEIPPLDERPEDVGLLISTFLSRFDGRHLVFAPAAYRALILYPWPLNVRELEKAMETAVALAGEGRIEVEHLPAEVREYQAPQTRTARTEPSDEDRRGELVRLLTVLQGNVSAVSRTMGFSRMQVHRWLKQYELNPDDFRG